MGNGCISNFAAYGGAGVLLMWSNLIGISLVSVKYLHVTFMDESQRSIDACKRMRIFM